MLPGQFLEDWLEFLAVGAPRGVEKYKDVLSFLVHNLFEIISHYHSHSVFSRLSWNWLRFASRSLDHPCFYFEIFNYLICSILSVICKWLWSAHPPYFQRRISTHSIPLLLHFILITVNLCEVYFSLHAQQLSSCLLILRGELLAVRTPWSVELYHGHCFFIGHLFKK